MFRKLITRAMAGVGIAAFSIAAGFALLAPADSARAADPPWPDAIYGRPYNFEAGGPNGWYLWHQVDSGRFNLCSTTPADILHPFIARIHTDGVFTDLQKLRLEGADDVVLQNGGKTLVVKFHTWSGTDCIEFRTNGNRLNFTLTEFGLRVPRTRIFLGHGAVNPPSNPFTITR
jgi:hypothetical protein